MQKTTRIDQMPYVLITPARNEEKLIEKVIQSVTSQTVPPTKWVIVNDGSTDATASIVSRYLGKYDWMELLNLSPHRDRSFAAKVADYLEFLLGKFEEDASLGVAGTTFREEGYSSATDSFEGQNHVAGGCQLFRRQCFEQIGGYIPNKAGGIDWIAVTTARMMDWKTRSFREKYFFHYRSLGTAERSLLASTFSYGEKDYYLGGHPLWELFRVAYRTTKRPYLVGGIALFSGYLSAFLRRMERPISKELMRFHRQEQMMKLKKILKSVLTFKRIDSFEVKPT